jgi:two-component system NtrC family sensor kinase
MESGQVDLQLRRSSDSEIGLLIDSFNRMARSISTTQKQLEQKLEELGKANDEIRDTQTHLVHAAKMASLGQLVAGVAHELNNPIGFIYSNMAHLRDYVDKLKKVLDVAEKNPEQLNKIKEQVEFSYIIEDLPRIVESVEDGARRTRDIVIGLRNFSRLDEAQLKRVNIHEGIDNTVTLLAGELKNRIKVHKKFGKLPEVKCYASQLNQVFMNIITNAAQAIEGNGDIWIKTEKEADWAVISIRDNGKGIPDEVVDKIFDPFFTTKPIGQGTGLGLSLTYGIVQRHGGQIQVLTKMGEGTEFVIRIPIDGPPDSDVVQLEAKQA